MIKEIINKLKGTKKKSKLKERKQEAIKNESQEKRIEKSARRQGAFTANAIGNLPENRKRSERLERTTSRKYKGVSPIFSRGVFSAGSKYRDYSDKIAEEGPEHRGTKTNSRLTTQEKAQALQEGYTAYRNRFRKKRK